MAVTISTNTASGLTAPAAYWRLNSFDQLANRQPDGTLSVPAVARFRAYATQAAFQSGKTYLDGCERVVTFTPSAIDADLAAEAYTALKALPEFAGAVDV